MTFRSLPLSALLLVATSPALAKAQMASSVGTWAASPVSANAGKAGLQDETLREIVHVSIPGNQHVTILLSNEFGVEPLTIGAATLAHWKSGTQVDTPVSVTFAGRPSATIPPGSKLESDEVNFPFPALSDVAVSLFIPAQKITTVTQHGFANTTNYIAPGDQTSALALTGETTNASWRYLKGVEVHGAAGSAIVCFGDSITDGARGSKDANLRWPDILATRLQASPKTATLGILNQGIGGNRILHDNTGPAAVDRFERDVLQQPGVKYVVILEGINDIGHAYDPVKTYDVVSADELIAGYKYLAARAHAHGIKVYGATLTPYGGAKYSSAAGEVVRSTLNNWIRSTKELDGVVDFDKTARDPTNPNKFLPAYDSGDNLHPNDAGYKAMGESIDLSLFTK